MNLHEYQAKQLLRQYGIPTVRAMVFEQATLALSEIQKLGASTLVVKAQVHAGGRGKAGGILLCHSPEEAFKAAKKMLGTTLATYQSGGVAKPVDRVLIEEAKPIAHELYLAVTYDRERALPCLIFSAAGGMDIETVSRETPEKIFKIAFDPEEADDRKQLNEWMSGLDVPQADRVRAQLEEFIINLVRMFSKLDAALIEINPLIVTVEGGLIPLDAKINLDDNALFRHPELNALRDVRQEDGREVDAKKYDLSYVGLNGTIGCMVNGAGLAMATMDIIKLHGGEPANFLDVGGGASKEKVTAAFKIILEDPHVKTILVNIFGGIMRCDIIAEGIIAAVQEVNLKVPLVVRLEGTNAEQGREILKKSKLSVIPAASFDTAAQQAVEAAGRKQ